MSASAAVLSLFWELASVDASKRQDAASSLVSSLAETQGDGDVACGDLTYTVRRLVRGLASSRDGARQGFGAALIEVLRTFAHVVELGPILAIMEEAMTLHGSMHGAEERDMLFGRLFTCASVLRCKQLASMPAERQSAVATRVCTELLFCFGKKTFLQEMAVVLLSELVDQLPPAEVQRLVWPQVAPLLAAPVQEWSAHALFIALRLCRVIPNATMAALLPHAALRSGTLLHAANLPLLVGPFKSASSVHPRLHCVWDEALGQLCGATDAAATPAAAAADGGAGGDAKKKKKKKKGEATAAEPAVAAEGGAAEGGAVDENLLRAFWQGVVEEGLVPSTLERKYMAFMLLQQVRAAAPEHTADAFYGGRRTYARVSVAPRQVAPSMDVHPPPVAPPHLPTTLCTPSHLSPYPLRRRSLASVLRTWPSSSALRCCAA